MTIQLSDSQVSAEVDRLAYELKEAEVRSGRRTLFVVCALAAAALAVMAVASSAIWVQAERAMREAQLAKTQATIAREAAEKAQANLNVALGAATRQLIELQTAINNGGIPSETANTLLASTQSTLEELAQIQSSPEITKLQTQLSLALADTYLSLGDDQRALEWVDRVNRIASQHGPEVGSDDVANLFFAASWRQGDILAYQAKVVEAIVYYQRAVEIARREIAIADRATGQKGADSVAWANNLSFSLAKLGEALSTSGDKQRALAAYEQALAAAQSAQAKDPKNAKAIANAATAQLRLGEVLFDTGGYDAALDRYKQALDSFSSLLANDPNDVRLRSRIADVQRSIGAVLQRQGKYQEALSLYQTALATMKQLVASDPDNVSWQWDLAETTFRVGLAYSDLGDRAAAKEQFQEALTLQEELARREPRNALYLYRIQRTKAIIETFEAEQRK